jgi:NADPH:quinone reductase-like Zn-dependent oxidoreductase
MNLYSLSINERKPSIKATDILIETKAAGLSPSDYKMVNTILSSSKNRAI